MASGLHFARTMRLRASFLLPALALAAGCSGGTSNHGSSTAGTAVDAQALTVSYRNKVRLPYEGETLSAEAFAKQLRERDPIKHVRCLADESPAYKKASEFLGGIAWSHPVPIIKDSAYPPLYSAKQDAFGRAVPEASADAGGSGASPVIERPDLVGVQNGIAIFLSQQHGLLAVDARKGKPKLSCSMKLPGDPKNFFFKGSELVVVVNARGGATRSALMRYSFDGAKYHFVDALMLEDQTVRDARTFDSTIALYSSWFKHSEPPKPSTSSGGARPSGGAGADVASSPVYSGGNELGTKMIVAKWDDKLSIDWEDALLNDPAKQDPLEGTDPNKKYNVGDLVDEQKTYQPFVSASDRYFVIPRTIHRTLFAGYERRSYQVCTDYNPKDHQVTVCSVNYERRPNPDYKAPDPVTGDYSCNGKKLDDCIQEAAPLVSQYVYVPVGKTCRDEWVGACKRYETKSETYPTYTFEDETALAVYRFEDGAFTKFDDSLSKMEAKADALAFTQGPLRVTGTVSNRNQIQFQNGHLYVFAADALQAMAVAGNSASFLSSLPIGADTDSNPTVVFSDKRAMISSRNPRVSNRSDVRMLDLSSPSMPKALTSFSMPGQSTQLILATGGILGPGDVALRGGNVDRSLKKLTLFSEDNGKELDNLLLGTEYDTFASSWLSANDDQRIRMADGGTRVFIPYSGRHHADEYEPTAHRLNITSIQSGRLVSERSFNVSDEIIRTAAIDDNRALVFANSAVYVVDRTTGKWEMTTLRELFVPFASYRLDDKDLYARLDRVGSKCRISTHQGDPSIFEEKALAQSDIACPEGATPTGIGRSLVFAQTRTGVAISDDGKAITPMAPEAVQSALDSLPDGYCYIDGAFDKGNGRVVDHLDAVPERILCLTRAQIEAEQEAHRQAGGGDVPSSSGMGATP